MRLHRALFAIAVTWGGVLACSQPAPPRVAPPGSGWVCFSPQPRLSLESSCAREAATCTELRRRAIEKDPSLTLSECASRPIAHCVRHWSELAVDHDEHFLCAATFEDCEYQRTTAGFTDTGFAKQCQSAR